MLAVVFLIAALITAVGDIIFIILFYRCPHCGGFLRTRYQHHYCPHCGNYLI
jgi:exosome complex RNA-binding protein Csl4